MNRATFLTTLAGGVCALPNLTAAETLEEKAIYDLLDSAIDAQFTYDFPRLAKLLHASALELFRSRLSAVFDHLLKSYSLDRIVAVSGLAAHPKYLDVTDAGIFIAACQSAKARHADFVGNPEFLPLKIHGTIFDDVNFAHVLYTYTGSIHTARTDFDYVSPNIFTVKREADTWQIYSCILARRVSGDWWRDLAGPEGANLRPK